MTFSANERNTMKRVVVDRFGGPEVLRVVEDDVPRPGAREVRVRVLAAGVSFTDAQLRAGTYIAGAPKPPFTPGYELVGVGADDRIQEAALGGSGLAYCCLPTRRAHHRTVSLT